MIAFSLNLAIYYLKQIFLESLNYGVERIGYF